VSEGSRARIGSITANQEWFKVWRTIDGEGDAPKAMHELEVMVRGAFEKRRLLDLLQHFIGTGIDVLGIDPAANVAAAAEERGVPTLVGFFGRDVRFRLFYRRGGAAFHQRQKLGQAARRGAGGGGLAPAEVVKAAAVLADRSPGRVNRLALFADPLPPARA